MDFNLQSSVHTLAPYLIIMLGVSGLQSANLIIVLGVSVLQSINLIIALLN